MPSKFLLPVEDDGKVSERIFNNASLYYGSAFSSNYNIEYNQSNFDYLSMKFWNETINNCYFKYNFSTDGIMTYNEIYCPPIPFVNLTLYSRPAQLPPEFSFTTEHDTLTVDSTDIKLNVSIMDADNNNDGVIDTDYLYRVKTGSTWTDWASILPLIDYDLGSVGAGSYNITLEVKNMYGVTQEEIIIQYIPGDQDAIPGSLALLVALMLTLGVFIILFRYRKKG